LSENLNGATTNYTYDDAGNRLTETLGATTTNYSYNNMNQLTQKVTGSNSIAYTYDNRGNLTKEVKTGASPYTYNYTYNARNMLLSTTQGAASYVYDADGRRTQETVNSVVNKFVWDEFSQYGDVLLEQNSANVTQTRYTYGMGRILAQTKSGNTQFLLPDAQGSTRLLINNSATTQQTYDYRAFGEMVTTPSPLQTRYLYTAQQFDSASGNYSLRARTYNPANGRFLTQDTYPYNFQNPVEINRYVYGINNPVRYMDASGMVAEYGAINANSGRSTQTTVGWYSREFLSGFMGGMAGWLLGKTIVNVIGGENFFSGDLTTNVANMLDFIIAGVSGGTLEVANFNIKFSYSIQKVKQKEYLLRFLLGTGIATKYSAISALKDSFFNVIYIRGNDIGDGMKRILAELWDDMSRLILVSLASGGINAAMYGLEKAATSWVAKFPSFPGTKAFIISTVDALTSGLDVLLSVASDLQDNRTDPNKGYH
jgi:RHS repeat-associated protein